jgi:hypothetical protein
LRLLTIQQESRVNELLPYQQSTEIERQTTNTTIKRNNTTITTMRQNIKHKKR